MNSSRHRRLARGRLLATFLLACACNLQAAATDQDADCRGVPCVPGVESRACMACRRTPRHLCAACRAKYHADRARVGPVVPAAALIADSPFPRFHPVPTRPVFAPPWFNETRPPRPEPAPIPPILRHLPPEKEKPEDASGGETLPSHKVPDESPSGWEPRRAGSVEPHQAESRPSWLFHPSVTARLDATGEPATGSRANSVGTFR